MKQSLFCLTSLLIAGAASSCVSLTQLNDFSASSSASIKNFENIGYSFQQHCTDACLFDAVKTFEIKRTLDCDCSSYKHADSVTQLIYGSIKGYLDGLTNLSNNKVTDYSFDAVKKALKSGSFGKIKVDTPEVNAYSKISKLLLKATTDTYRQKKLKQYVAEANPSLQILLTKFHFILQSNLEGELKWKEDELYRYFKEMRTSDLSEYEKGKATSEYYEQLSDIRAIRKKISVFIRGITAIAAGHQKLYEGRDKMSTKELKALLVQYASEIRDIISEFNKINKS